MRTTIDAAGRVVVPLPIRRELGLKGGEEVDVTARDGTIEIAVAPTPMRLERHGGGIVAVPETDVPTLTAEVVRDALERTRR